MAVTSDYFCRKIFARMFCMSAVSGISLAASNSIDAVCVGTSIGENGLAAIGIVSPIYILYNVVGYGFSVGGSVKFARLAGKGDEKEAVRHFNEMILLLMIFSAVFMTAGNLFLAPILTLLGAGPKSGELFGLCGDYAKILITAFPVFMMNFICNDFLRCDNNQNLATAAFVVGSAMDFALNIVFVLMLRLGIKGAAYATVAAQLIRLVISLPHFFMKGKLLKFKAVKPDFKRCFKSLKTGVSTSASFLFTFVFILTVNHMLMSGDTVSGGLQVAVFNVVMNISYIANSLFLALGEALRPIVSTFYAEHNYSQARYVLKLSLIWGYVLNGIVILMIFIFSKQFSMLFGIQTSEGLVLSEKAVKLFCAGAFLSGAAMIFSSYYQSVKEDSKAARITLLRTFVILFPVSVILCMINTELFWYAMPVSELLTFIAVAVYAARGSKETTDDSRCFSYMLSEINKLGDALEKTELYCERQNIDTRQRNMVLMFIEETCEAIIRNAFRGRKDEFILLTIVAEEDCFLLHVWDSAVSFNPFDMKTKKMTAGDDDDYINSVGVLMMKNKAKEFFYRSYQGFNMLTIKF